MTPLTRGPLAPGVYWRRRLAALGVLLLLVLGVSRLFGGGGGDSGAKAADMAAVTTPSTSASPTPSSTPTSALPSAEQTVPTPSTPVPTASVSTALPSPTGRCSDDDIVVAPSVSDAQATKPVIVRLTLRTQVTAACTWQTSPSAIQLKITSGSDEIWSTLDCPRAVPTQTVVVRRDSDAVVNVAWNTRRSDAQCSDHTQWVMPGYYHVEVAALGGEPQDIQFALRKPRPTPTPAPTPTPTASATPAGPPTTAAPTTGARQEPQSDPTAIKKKHRRVD